MRPYVEFGGFLPLEGYGTEYYEEQGDNRCVLRMNAARYAIVEAYKDSGCKLLWIPVYNCQSVYEALEKNGVPFEAYNIGPDFLPEKATIADDECILITNYFGIHGTRFYDTALKKYKNIIFDNTQSFFATPIMRAGVYNVYSPRKFVGVSDGAYMIARTFLIEHPLEPDHSAHRAGFLMRAHEEGSNAVYGVHLMCEADLTASGPRNMSMLTQRLLSNVDYKSVREKRRSNFSYLHKNLVRYNRLNIVSDGECPMVYPLLTEHGGENLRAYFIENHVYVPQWWKWILERKTANDWERKLSKFLYPLPIDQRYTEKDMEALLRIVMEGL